MADSTPIDDGAGRFQELVTLLATAERPPVQLAPARDAFPTLADIDIEDLQVAGPHGPVAVRAYRARSALGIGLVWVHGGAFISGDLNMPESHWVSLELAARGIDVLALDYRKALNGVHHPVLSDEVLAGWLFAATTNVLDVPAHRLHLGGASAGANLVAGVALRLRQRRLPGPASMVLVYPVLHSALPEPGPAAAAATKSLPAGKRFTHGFMSAVNLNYVGDPARLADPIAFPATAELVGLPPTFILNAEADDLRASGEAFASQLRANDVSVLLEFEPGTTHGYLNEPELPTALESVIRIGRWLGAAH